MAVIPAERIPIPTANLQPDFHFSAEKLNLHPDPDRGESSAHHPEVHPLIPGDQAVIPPFSSSRRPDFSR